ncbi:hypothetical protein [Paenibacillus sp. FSL L8-0708]|uniref:hypothetical protein n=1 Tax=Paenibacillus sp. FSL L8-0708 TaxID=2975311 RepID=UPI0030FCC608
MIDLKIVQQKVFVNATEATVNVFLSSIPAEDIVSTHFCVYGDQGASDEWTTIFYRKEVKVSNAQ